MRTFTNTVRFGSWNSDSPADRARHAAVFTAIALLASLVLLAAAPRQAAASTIPCRDGGACAIALPTTLDYSPSYKGYASVVGDTIHNDCRPTPGALCAAWASMIGPTATAWYWTGRTWVRASLSANERIYAWPYAGGYHWAYSYRTNAWYAIRSSQLDRALSAPVYGHAR